MKVFLHICCGPCAIYAAKVLRQEGFEVDGFFYNPNIHPFSEYMKRYEAVVAMGERLDLGVIRHTYDFERFLKEISKFTDREDQHRYCWRTRLEETARAAGDKEIPYFTTTLLASPYQDIDEIKRLGEEIASRFGLKFIVRDFRRGFSQSHQISKEWQLYHQNYCGCVYSEKESIEQREKKRNNKGGAVGELPEIVRILVVDDDEEMVRVMQSILAKAGYAVDWALDGAVALEKARKNNFQLVFLDLDLPKMGGVEIFRNLKNMFPHLKVCIVTGWPKGVDAQEDDYISLLSEGAVDKMLRKPFIKDEVLKAAQELLYEQ